MKRRSKTYREVAQQVERTRSYDLGEAISLVQGLARTKFDSSVDIAVNLGVDPRHADQNVRGAVALPHGIGKTIRVIVFAKGEKAVAASEAGAEAVGGDDLAARIQDGWLEFDQVIATPDMMAVVGKLGRVLGPRGLMPNPKLGTVTFEVGNAIREAKSGRAEFRVDKGGVVHASVGKVSMPTESLQGNIAAVLDALLRAKPATSKGVYLRRMAVSSTMGPGVRVSVESYR